MGIEGLGRWFAYAVGSGCERGRDRAKVVLGVGGCLRFLASDALAVMIYRKEK